MHIQRQTIQWNRTFTRVKKKERTVNNKDRLSILTRNKNKMGGVSQLVGRRNGMKKQFFTLFRFEVRL